MTLAEHAALSAQLALALGWRIVDVVEVTDYEGLFVDTVCKVRHKGARFSRLFDYRDPSVALPVLEWFGVHHSLNVWSPERGGWSWSTGEGFDGHCDTLHEAIARAAIAVSGGGK